MDPVGFGAAMFSIAILVGSAAVNHHNGLVTNCLMTSTEESKIDCPEYISSQSIFYEKFLTNTAIESFRKIDGNLRQ